MFGNTVKDGSGTAYWVLQDSEGRIVIVPAWSINLEAEETINDSDKSFVVPASTEWKIESIWVEFTSTATAGDRQIVIEIQDGSSDVVFQVRAGAVQAASLTRYYSFAPHLSDLTSFRNTTFLMTPIPELILPASYTLRIYDNSATDAAADDMIVQIRYSSRSV